MWNSGLRVKVQEFRVQVLWDRVEGIGCRVRNWGWIKLQFRGLEVGIRGESFRLEESWDRADGIGFRARGKDGRKLRERFEPSGSRAWKVTSVQKGSATGGFGERARCRKTEDLLLALHRRERVIPLRHLRRR